MVDNVLYVTGGVEFTVGDDSNNYPTSILSWNPSTETWQPAGELAVARYQHAGVAVPSSFLSSECSTML